MVYLNSTIECERKIMIVFYGITAFQMIMQYFVSSGNYGEHYSRVNQSHNVHAMLNSELKGLNTSCDVVICYEYNPCNIKCINANIFVNFLFVK